MNSKYNGWRLASIGTLCLVSSLAWGQKRIVRDDGWQRAEEITETREISRSAPVLRTAPVRRTESVEAPPPKAYIPVGQGAEMRGMWVVRDTLTSPANIRQMVEAAASNGINTLFVQVRGRGDAFYNSPYEPRAEVLFSQPDSFDPLAYTIREAHARGLQVHAWLNTYLTWSGRKSPKSPDHLWNAHPDWFATDKEGRNSPISAGDTEGAFLQPSNPEVQEHLFKVFTSVVQNYEVDGIHFDYVRYANSRYDYSTATLRRFRDYLSTNLSRDEVLQTDRRVSSERTAWAQAYPQEWEAWRRAQVTSLVSRVAEAARRNKPQIQVTAAVYPNSQEASRYRGQEWQSWLQQGYLDAVVLMSYSAQTEKVVQQAQEAVEVANGRRVYVGLGAWRLSVQDVTEKIHEVRMVGANGFCLFSYDSLKQTPDYLPTLSRAVMSANEPLRLTRNSRRETSLASRDRSDLEERDNRRR